MTIYTIAMQTMKIYIVMESLLKGYPHNVSFTQQIVKFSKQTSFSVTHVLFTCDIFINRECVPLRQLNSLLSGMSTPLKVDFSERLKALISKSQQSSYHLIRINFLFSIKHVIFIRYIFINRELLPSHMYYSSQSNTLYSFVTSSSTGSSYQLILLLHHISHNYVVGLSHH